jgi:hypothetical protein
MIVMSESQSLGPPLRQVSLVEVSFPCYPSLIGFLRDQTVTSLRDGPELCSLGGGAARLNMEARNDFILHT